LAVHTPKQTDRFWPIERRDTAAVANSIPFGNDLKVGALSRNKAIFADKK
jgi:hypothetical protein